MTDEEIKNYQEKLEKEKAALLQQIKGYEKPVDFGSDVDSWDEEADEAEELGRRLALTQDLKKRLDQIESALKRIKERSYGKCERCRSEISKEVLDIVPESEWCAKCKQLGLR